MTSVRKAHVSLREQKEAQQALILQGYVQAMRGNQDIAAVQEESLVALSHIIAKGAGIRTLVRTGGLDTIVLAMGIHVDTPDIQQRGATALATVALVGDDCRDAVVQSGAVQVLVNATNRHPDLPAVLERCCHALGVVAAGNEAAKNSLIDAKAVSSVTRAIQAHPRRANLVSRGMTVLSHVAGGDTACKLAIVHTGGVAAVCEAMEDHAGNVDVQQTGCFALAGVSRGGASCVKSIHKAGGIKRLVAALRWYPTQGTFVHVVASAFANIAAHIGGADGAETRAEILSSNVLHHLINAINRHLHKAAVSERGLAALCNLMICGETFVASAVRYFGMDYIGEAMAAHPRNTSLLLQACHCVLNAAAVGDLDAKEALVHVSAPDRILQAMSNNPMHERLIEAGCAALANIAASPDHDEHDEELTMSEGSLRDPVVSGGGPASAPSRPGTDANRPGTSASVSRSRPGSRRGDEGGRNAIAVEQLLNIRTSLIESGTAFNVIKAMSDFKQVPNVAEEGLCVLRNLAAGESSMILDRLIKCEAAQAISYTMEGHASSLPICLQGCLAIRNLGCGTSRHLSLLIEAGGITTLIDALERHPGVPSLAQAAIAALRNLAVDSWGSDQPSRFSQSAGSVGFIVQADGPTAIVEAMKACADSAAVQAQGCGALRNLACGTLGDKQSRTAALEALRTAGAAEVVMSALEHHNNSSARNVLTQGCAALRNLATDAECKAMLIKLDVVPRIVGVLRAHRESVDTIEQAAACLANLTHAAAGAARPPREVDDARKAAVDAGAVSELCACLRERPRSAPIGMNACACLTSLMGADGAVAHELCESQVVSIIGSQCVSFGPDAHSAIEHASSALCRLLSTGGQEASQAVGAMDGKVELLHALQRAHERGVIKGAEPGLDILFGLLVPR